MKGISIFIFAALVVLSLGCGAVVGAGNSSDQRNGAGSKCCSVAGRGDYGDADRNGYHSQRNHQ